MRIAVCLDRSRLLRWHLILITALQSKGHAVGAEFRPQSNPLPASVLAILDFDAVRSGYSGDRLSNRLTGSAFAGLDPFSDGTADLTIDLSTSTVVGRLPGRVLRPLYDGTASDEALFQALLAGRAPWLRVSDTLDGGAWAIGLPALEQPTRLARALENVTSRLIEGLVRVVAGIADGKHPSGPPMRLRSDEARRSMLAAAIRFGARRTASKVSRVRDRISGNRPRWRVAWRRVAAGMRPRPESLKLSDFRILKDDGRRFYADPFVVVRNGGSHVFVEELPADTGIGVISHFIISESGEATRPEPVLSMPTHLSYPFIFEHDGETWMMPESAAAGGLDLYRCQRFPDSWIHEARILEGTYHDATLFIHEGRLWIAAATEAFQSSTWDSLSLFHASALLGPWIPHARNPVLLDVRCARPAGPLWRDGGNLLRPAQDCSNGYGSRLSIRRILRLTPDEFAEETIGTTAFADTRILGPHTICRSGGLEFIDFYARDNELGGE